MSHDAEDNILWYAESELWVLMPHSYVHILGLKPSYMSEGDSMACSPAEETPP